jgi:carbon-monoxide dehydrogenase small subunit
MTQISVNFNLNGENIKLTSPPNRTLLDVLRNDLGLTGAKDACGGEGECGACTVILDGSPVNSCMILIGQVEGTHVKTIEGLRSGDKYYALQKAFVETGAVQCGYCIPGAILAAAAMLDNQSNPTDQQIREGISGNLCRCTGYNKMIDAVHLYLAGEADD